MSFFETTAGVGQLTVKTNSTIGTVGTTTGLSVAHKQIGALVKTTVTLASVAQAIVNGTEYQSTLLFTFPKGKIAILGTSGSITQTTTSELATTLNASSTGAVAVGTAAASSTTLSSTMADLIASFAFVSSATINVAGTTVTSSLDNVAGGTLSVLDGTSTAKLAYLNTAFATTGDVDGDATQTLSGSVVITWLFLGGQEYAFEV